MPKYRTQRYAVWKACERLGVLPPDIKGSWDENNIVSQAAILAYERIRSNEEVPDVNKI